VIGAGRDPRMAENDELNLPWELAEAARTQLQPGERLIWCAQPDPGSLVRKSLCFALPRYAMLFVISQLPFWLDAASLDPEDREVPAIAGLIVGLPFILAMTARLMMARLRAARTIYLITDQRAAIVSTHPGRKIVSFSPKLLAPEIASKRRDGAGEIVLTRDRYARCIYGRTWLRFVGVDRVEHVKRLLDGLAAGAAGDGRRLTHPTSSAGAGRPRAGSR
jgi:hypothetical protein